MLAISKIGWRPPRVELLVLQGTPFCNLNCAYCYLPNRQSTNRMSEATLARVFERLAESPFLGEQLTVVWHAGEPLTLPVSYYETAFEIIENLSPPRLRVDHCMQTNGVLIDDAWVDFLREWNICVGVSLDGPKELHDAFRTTRSGRGSFERTMAGVRKLQVAGINFHVISVLTRKSLKIAEELFWFYVEHDIRDVGFNIEEIEAAHATSSLDYDGVEDEFRKFLAEILRLSRENPSCAPRIREITHARAQILGPAQSSLQNQQTEPFRILSVDTDGNVSTFSPELLGVLNERFANFIIGNVHRHSLVEMSKGTIFRQLSKVIREGAKNCARDCEYFALCGGGAPANKLFENGKFESTETLYCALTLRSVLDVVLEEVERTLASPLGHLSSGHGIPIADSSAGPKLET
jgi:uncharacterized protein